MFVHMKTKTIRLLPHESPPKSRKRKKAGRLNFMVRLKVAYGKGVSVTTGTDLVAYDRGEV